MSNEKWLSAIFLLWFLKVSLIDKCHIVAFLTPVYLFKVNVKIFLLSWVAGVLDIQMIYLPESVIIAGDMNSVSDSMFS